MKTLLKSHQGDFYRAMIGLLLLVIMVPTLAVPSALASVIALTTAEQEWLKAHPDITFGYTDQFEPAVIVNKDGSYRGTLVDFLDLLNQRLGTDFKIMIKPIPEAFRQVSQKEMAGILSLHPDNADKRGFLKTQSYTTSYPTIFARKGLSFNAPSDLAAKRIALIDHVFFSQNQVALHGHGSTLIKVKTALAGLEAVKNGTADIFIGSSRNSYLLGKYQFFDLAAVFEFFDHPTPNVMGVRSDWPQLVTILNKGLATISVEEAESIERKWIGAPEQNVIIELSKEEQTWLKANPSIKVGIFPLPPYTFVKDGRNQGYLVDMMQLLAGQAGFTPEISMQALPETFAKVKSGQIHAVLGIMRNKERAGFMYFSENVLKLEMGIFARASRSDIRDAASLKNKIIASRKSYGFEHVVKKYLPDAKIIRADDAEGMLRLVASGEADAAIRERHSGEFILRNSFINNVNIKGFFTPPGLPTTTGSEFGVSKKFPLLNSILKKAYQAIPASEKTRVWRKWFASVESQEKTIELTEEEQTWIEKNHTVRVRVANWPPYLIVRGNEPPQGIVIEYLKLIEERTGITFNYEVTDQPFAEFLEQMQQHQGPDMAALIINTPEREQYLSFTQPYISSPYVIFTREQDDLILDIHGLAGKTLAVTRGFIVEKLLTRDYSEIKRVLFDSDEQALQAVATGQADAYIGGLTVASHIIHKRGLSDLRVAAPSPFGEQSLAMGNRNDWPQLTSIVNKALASITEAEKTAIRNKYVALKYETGINRAEVVKWVLGVAGLASGMIFLMLFWNRSLSNKVKERTGALETSNKSLEAEISERKRVEEELLHLKDQLHEENIYLREEIQLGHNFNEIIGNSEGLRYVLFRVEQIAATDTTVLIMGETGTGKELIARAIHDTSPRKERPFIKVNCATLSAHLIESELFGHEKGAFTGATVQRIGRFELADGATLFLDEIGEMPLELQSKLLSVLQDGEFERVGSSRTIKVDVRLIAATNRDLETEIQSGRFRQDLFYRLNVYSLTLPPLRERRDDIPLLMDAFIKTYNKKLGKHIELVSTKTKEAMVSYSWPGNIRELKNVIEKAVVVNQDKTLRVELPETQTPAAADDPIKTLDEMERDYIQEILSLKNWRIDGPQGAAVVLDLKPSTLRYRLQKLGLKRPS